MIEARGISKDYGEFHLQDISLRVEEGEYMVILGPTGAGKTVLLECLAGLEQPDGGEVWIGGTNVTRWRPEARGIGYVPQDYGIFPHMQVEANLGFGLRARGSRRPEIAGRVQEMAALLGIEHLLHRRPRTLSGGELQRVALGRALLAQPRALLLDEPLSALDERTRDELAAELIRLPREFNTAVIHVSHNFQETASVADRVAIFHDGLLQQVGSREEVFQRPQSLFVARFVGCENVFEGTATKSHGRPHVSVHGQSLAVATEALPGPVGVTIRPEEIHVSTTPNGDGSPPQPSTNPLAGRLVRVEDRATVIRMEVDVGFPLRVALTRQVYRRLAPIVGQTIYLHIPPETLWVFPLSGAERAGEA